MKGGRMGASIADHRSWDDAGGDAGKQDGARSQAGAPNNAMRACKAQIGGSCEIETWTCAGP
jgi:hypothetical protein